LRSNGNAFGSYYADPEAGLLYARARYFGPISGQFVSRDPVEGEANLPITWGAYQYGRSNPYRYSDPNGKCDTNSTLGDCATEVAGGLVGSIGLTAVKAVEGAVGGLEFVADGYMGLLGNKAAQKRNSERLDLINGVIDNADKIPAAVKQAIVNIDEKAQAEEAAGNKFTASMLRGNYAGEIALAVAALPQAARSAVNLVDMGLAKSGNTAAKGRVVARALARELDAAEPALAAKTPTIVPENVRPLLGSGVPDLLAEAGDLRTVEKALPTSKTARAVPSEPCCFAPGTVVATEAGDRLIESIRIGERVWTRLEDGTGEAFLAPVTATHIRHDRPILRLSVEEVGEAGEQREETVATVLRGVVRSEDLLVTPGHPFYVPERGFVSVEELQPGDELVSLATQTRLRVKAIVLEAPQGTTHNLTVEAGHTFFVGGLGTWVHNVGPCNTCPGGLVEWGIQPRQASILRPNSCHVRSLRRQIGKREWAMA
jgi:RHS repeat-associated protein